MEIDIENSLNNCMLVYCNVCKCIVDTFRIIQVNTCTPFGTLGLRQILICIPCNARLELNGGTVNVKNNQIINSQQIKLN